MRNKNTTAHSQYADNFSRNNLYRLRSVSSHSDGVPKDHAGDEEFVLRGVSTVGKTADVKVIYEQAAMTGKATSGKV